MPLRFLKSAVSFCFIFAFVIDFSIFPPSTPLPPKLHTHSSTHTQSTQAEVPMALPNPKFKKFTPGTENQRNAPTLKHFLGKKDKQNKRRVTVGVKKSQLLKEWEQLPTTSAFQGFSHANRPQRATKGSTTNFCTTIGAQWAPTQ